MQELSTEVEGLIRELIMLEANNKLAALYINPPGAGGLSAGQREFFEDNSRKRFLRACNKSGKSYLLSAEVWSFLAGTHPRNDHWKVPTPCTILYVCPDLQSSYADDVCKRLHELEPPGVLHKSCSYDMSRGYITSGKRQILLSNGSQVIFRSGKQDGVSLAGISAHVVVINEPPMENRWGEIMRAGAEHNAPILMAFTPMDNHSVSRDLRWLRQIVEDSSLEESARWSQTVITLTHKNVPHRTEEDISSQIDNCPAPERPQRIFAEWEGAASGRMIEGFSDECLRSDLPNGVAKIGLSFDHGTRPGNQVCLLFLYWKEFNVQKAMLLDEYISGGRTTSETDAMRVLEMLDRRNISPLEVDFAVGDVNDAGKNALTNVNKLLEQSFSSLLRTSYPPFEIHTASKFRGSILYGIRVINHALLDERLFIHPRCERTIYDIRHWQGTKLGDDGERTHTIDAFRYFGTPVLDISIGKTRAITDI